MAVGLLPAFRQKKAPTAPQGALSPVSELMPLMQALSEKAWSRLLALYGTALA